MVQIHFIVFIIFLSSYFYRVKHWILHLVSIHIKAFFFCFFWIIDSHKLFCRIASIWKVTFYVEWHFRPVISQAIIWGKILLVSYKLWIAAISFFDGRLVFFYPLYNLLKCWTWLMLLIQFYQQIITSIKLALSVYLASSLWV